MTTTETERTLAAMSSAAESARQANHAAYTAPRTTGSVYDRAGMLHDLLGKVEQLAAVLGEQAGTLPADGLYSTDDVGPGAHLGRASSSLGLAAQAIRDATGHVNDAWSEVSPIGERG